MKVLNSENIPNLILQSGFLVLLLSGISFVVGYEFQRGIYAGFRIMSAEPVVNPGTYVMLLNNVSLMFSALIVIGSFKDNLLRLFSDENSAHRKRDLIATPLLLVLSLILIGIAYFVIDGLNLERAVHDVWNRFLAYILLFGFGAITLVIVFGYLRNIMAERNRGHNLSWRMVHYSIEGLIVLVLSIGGIMLTSTTAEHLGREVVLESRDYTIATKDQKKYLILQDQGDKYLAVPICKVHPILIKGGAFTYFEKNNINLESKKLKIDASSFC